MIDYRKEYFDWMVKQVDGEGFQARKHMKTLRFLQAWDFDYSHLHPMDKNRAEDALDMRFEFLDQYDERPFDTDKYFGKPSVLEVLVALAIRMEDDILFEPEYGDRVPRWFDMMLYNLGLDDGDYRFDQERAEKNLAQWLDGKTALFPILGERAEKNDLWSQMNRYFAREF